MINPYLLLVKGQKQMKDGITDEKTSDTADLTKSFLPTAVQEAIKDGNENLPEAIVRSIAISNAKSIGEQPAILANLALANQIFNINLAQQNANTNQQVMNQVMMAALAKCVETIMSVDSKDPQAIEKVKDIVKEFFDLLHTQTTENIRTQQELFDKCIATLNPENKTDLHFEKTPSA